MEMAEDGTRYSLDRPILHAPGEVWTYSGGAVALIGRLIERGTGEPLDEFARRTLFGPLGIDRFEWVRGLKGELSAASGLRLRLPDLAKIGRLILASGAWEGKRLVPAEWLEASFRPRGAPEGLRYGYLWWLSSRGDPPAWVAGFGNGGQRLTVQPGIELIVAVMAGNYNQPDAWRIPVSIIEEFVAPAVRAREAK